MAEWSQAPDLVHLGPSGIARLVISCCEYNLFIAGAKAGTFILFGGLESV